MTRSSRPPRHLHRNSTHRLSRTMSHSLTRTVTRMAAAHLPRTMVRLLSYPLKTPTETAYLAPIVRKYRRPGKTTKRHWRKPAQVAMRRKFKKPAKSTRRRMRTITNKRDAV